MRRYKAEHSTVGGKGVEDGACGGRLGGTENAGSRGGKP